MSPETLEKLRVVYRKLPPSVQPHVKELFYWGTNRIVAVLSRRKIYSGHRIQFLHYEIADLEPYEVLGPKKDEVLIEACASPISPGTERGILCGLPGTSRRFPTTPGYSVAGRVLEVGHEVVDIAPGDRVVAAVPHMSHAVTGTEHLFKIPDGVSYSDACFTVLGIVAVQGVRKARIVTGDRVAVVGQGLIGQLCNRVARLAGATTLIAVASSPRRQDASFGPDRTTVDEFYALLDTASDIDRIRADVVIEAVGTKAAIVTAARCAREGGRVVLVGSSRGLIRELDLYHLFQKRAIEVIGAHSGATPTGESTPHRWNVKQEGDLFLEFLRAGRLEVSDLITWRPEPRDCNHVYETLIDGAAAHVGIVFDWQAPADACGRSDTTIRRPGT